MTKQPLNNVNRFMQLFAFILALLWFTSSAALASEIIRLSGPVAKDDITETFGAVLDENLPRVNLISLMKEPSKKIGQKFLISTKVAKVCQKKGCFFIAQQNETIVRVSFKDYSFFIPTDSTNKDVLLAGELVIKNMSIEQAEHFNSDLGLSNKLKPGEVYEIVAEGIQIPI